MKMVRCDRCRVVAQPDRSYGSVRIHTSIGDSSYDLCGRCLPAVEKFIRTAPEEKAR